MITTSRKSLRALLWAAGCYIALPLSGFSGEAHAAAFATGGSSPYTNQVLWLTWGGGGANGTNNVVLAAGATTTANISVGGQPVVVTCAIGTITRVSGTGSLASYRPGNWGGDALDDLYNIGGTGVANQLISGIYNSTAGTEFRFPITCTATLSGSPYDLPGVVVADAEQGAGSSGEFIEGTADGMWQITEKFASAGCTSTYPATLTAAGTIQTLRLAGSSAFCGQGPMAVGFLTFNATAYTGASRAVTMNFDLKGGGRSALAIGLLLPNADTSDAPASYGSAFHLFPPTLTPDGLAVGATVDINAAGFTLSTLTNPATDRLGAMTDADGTGLVGNAAATTDDTSGSDDEDAVNVGALPALLVTNAGAGYTVPVSCAGAGSVRGWIDFNRNGVFTDAGEISTLVSCAAGSASIVFTIPAAITTGASYLRVRYSTLVSELNQPTGVAGRGEVEDHLLAIGTQLRLAKAWGPNSIPGNVASIGATTGLTNNTVGFTSTASTNTNGAPVTVFAGETATLPAETFTTGTLANYATALACDNGVTPSGSNGQASNTVVIPSNVAALITCTYTNSRRPTLRLQKTLPLGRFVAADQFTLTIAGAGGPATVTTTGAGTVATGTALLGPGTAGTSYTLSEAGASGAVLSNYTTTYSCTNTLAGGQTPAGSGTSFNISAVVGDDLTCTLSNTRQPLADLRLTKTNTPGVNGEVDQGGDTLVSGVTTNYSIVATNNGPDAADNAVMTDPATAGLTCVTASCTATGGAVCPAQTGAALVAALQGAGATVPTLPVGGSVTFVLSCQVP